MLISDKHIPRGLWKVGRISAVEPGIDGRIRRVSVQNKLVGNDSQITIERPVQRLVVILPVEEQNDVNDNN